MNKQETLTEAAENYADFSNDYVPMSFGGEFNETTKRDFIAGAKWQQERMYSEEDMQEYAEFCIECDRANLKPIIAKDWFEQFKKK